MDRKGRKQRGEMLNKKERKSEKYNKQQEISMEYIEKNCKKKNKLSEKKRKEKK